MSTQKNSLTIKDLVTTGIFSALCFILVLLGGVFFGANPVLTFWMPVGSALLAGPVFLLLIAKVPKHGPLTIVGIITGLIFFVTGLCCCLSQFEGLFSLSVQSISPSFLQSFPLSSLKNHSISGHLKLSGARKLK